jgi:ATP-dependent DNA ligase
LERPLSQHCPRRCQNLPCKSAIIDGEAIVQNGHGASDFEALHQH